MSKLPEDADRESIVKAVTDMKIAAQKKLDAIRPPQVDTPSSRLIAEIAALEVCLSLIPA